MTRRARRRSRGQSMVEFALVLPLFILLVSATIDFGGYFGSRLAVEDAANTGARVAAVQDLGSTYSGVAVLTAIEARQGPASVATNPEVDCTWNGTALNPDSYPPFSLTGSSCIGIWYFDIAAEPTGPATLCAQWSVQNSWWVTWNIVTGVKNTDVSSSNFATDTGTDSCVSPGADIVVVGVGYQYKTLTPLPAIASGALTTYGETQVLEEG